MYMDVHVKETDKQLYVNHKSCHPPSTKKGLADSFGLHFKRICERDEDHNKQEKSSKEKLNPKRGSGKSIESQLEKAGVNVPRKEATGYTYSN